MTEKQDQPAEKPKRGKSIDWEKVEAQYRAGVLSIRSIATRHDVSDKAIRNKAKEMGWERDLHAKVQQKVRTEMVRSEVRTDAEMRTERDIVDMAATQTVAILRDERSHIARLMRLAVRLMDEFESALSNKEDIAEAIEEETDKDKGPARRNAMLKAISLHQNSITLGNIGSALRTAVALERQSYNIPDDDTTPPPAPPTPMEDLSDDELDKRIAAAAKEGGISLAAVRESAQDT